MSLVAGVPGNLTCRSRGDARPAPELLWFRDGIRLDGTSFHQVRFKSLCHSLFIIETQRPLQPPAYLGGNGSHSGLKCYSGREPDFLAQSFANYLLLHMVFNLFVPQFSYRYYRKNSSINHHIG